MVLTVEGEPRDLVTILVSDRPALELDAGSIGPNSLGRPVLRRVPLGMLPASGRAQVTFTTDDLPSGSEFQSLYVQAVHVTPGLEIYRGAPTAVVVLDAAL